MSTVSPLGVVIVTYNSADVILSCLESLLAAAEGAPIHVTVVDNRSTDGTVALLQNWAAGNPVARPQDDYPFPAPRVDRPLPLRGPDDPGPGVTLIEADANTGFAAGVNRGLAHLAAIPEIDRFWILNPDCVVPPGVPALLAGWTPPGGDFALIGHRIRYFEAPGDIQSDGGRVNWLNGVTSAINLGCQPAAAHLPGDDQLDFIPGASMVASRAFYDRAGPLPEDYFLFYEEVAWAQERGDLPLANCPDALIYHRAGTSIGSPTTRRMASPFSFYFKYRGRMIFMRHYRPLSLPLVFVYAMGKVAQLMLKGYPEEALAILRAITGGRPPDSVLERLSEESLRLIRD
ncbi:MAG: glycosyltransferase family 2 protein [Marinibacterium sp.]